tara:strand:- start:1988 stop:2983 length:996 start_codon:yes stop_codon:yes gene_type:complete
MKNKLIATIVAFGLVGSTSAIEINDNLSVNGFIDASYQEAEASVAGASAKAAKEGLDEIELNFLLNVGSVSGELHLDTAPSSSNDIGIEQAHFTYSLENGVSIKFGRYGSELGFEREDPSGRFAQTRAHDLISQASTLAGGPILGITLPNYDLGDIDGGNVYEGVTISYNLEDFSVSASFHEDVGANLETEDIDIELSFSYTGIENAVIGGGYRFDNKDDGATTQMDVLNIHASYTLDKLLVAAEFTSIENSALMGEDAYLLLANYEVSDKLGITLRYSESEITNSIDVEKITIAPSYQITESLGAILEYSDYEISTLDADLLALELTYNF